MQDKHLQQQGLRRTTRGRQRVRNKWITGCAQIKRQAVCDLSSASEVAYFDEDVDDDDEQAKVTIVKLFAPMIKANKI